MKPARKIIALLFITFALFYLIDVGFGILNAKLHFFPDKIAMVKLRDRYTTPAYKNESYFSDDFLADSFENMQETEQIPFFRIVMPKEFHGKYYHTDKSGPVTYRRTANQFLPGKDVTIVSVVGGSTVYCSEVPDEFTLPSQLSVILNTNGERYYHVVNIGMNAAHSSLENERMALEFSVGVTPDVLVVYNGVNDVLQSVFYKNPLGSMPGDDHFRFNKSAVQNDLGLMSMLPLNIYNSIKVYKGYDAALKEIKEISADQNREAQLYSDEIAPLDKAVHSEILRLANLAKKVWMHNIELMQKITEDKGLKFYVFLQPHAFRDYKDKNAADLRLVYGYQNRFAPEMETAFRLTYPLLQEGVIELQKKGVNAYDLSDLFVDKKTDIFLDGFHVNSIGNNLAANAIAQKIER